MILYLGSSSLIKLYATEVHSEELREWVRVAEIVATARIAYTEVTSALNIRLKKGDVSTDDFVRASERFAEDWESFAKVDFDDREAGRFVEQYGLSRFGALHLSAAKLILGFFEKQSVRPGKEQGYQPGISLFFSSADRSLLNSAIREGLKILPLG